ncbi:MAG TPA: DNA polymerase III subunit delta [Erythrobacter sp.]|nr:DNA polymerase III subunit delta [Erythrobacter sp.]
MKATQRDFLNVARRAQDSAGLWFFCGADEAGASAAAAKVIALLPEAGERVDLSGAELKSDPVRLIDEARSTSLFGGARHIMARVAGEEAHDAVKAFCEFADIGETGGACPIFIIATSATDKSRTAKLLIDRKDAVVAIFYPPDLEHVKAEINAMAGGLGLRFGGNIAEAIARGANLDVRLAQSELEKLSLYLDASPHSTRTVEVADLAAIGASSEDEGFGPVVNVVLAGETRKLPHELARLRELGLNPVGVALALERRVAQIAAIAAKREPGLDVDALLDRQKVFFRDKRDLRKQLPAWPPQKLERLVPRLAQLHRDLLANSQSAELILAHELTRIARFASVRRH